MSDPIIRERDDAPEGNCRCPVVAPGKDNLKCLTCGLPIDDGAKVVKRMASNERLGDTEMEASST